MNAFLPDATAQFPMSATPPAKLVTEHLPLIRRIAAALAARLPEHVDSEDLVQAGTIALLEAAKSYQDSRGATFTTYAGIRIRGAMIDELRKVDWAPRSVRRNAREIAEAASKVRHRTGAVATNVDIAAELGIDVEEYHDRLAESASAQIVPLSASNAEGEDGRVHDVADPADGPETHVERQDFSHVVGGVVRQLPERERAVVSMRYQSDLDLNAIGKALKLSPSRIGQIHGEALARLRTMMRGCVG